MKISSRAEPVILFLGDIFVLLTSLWLMLFVRYMGPPEEALWVAHFKPFIILYAIWCVVFFISGLYEKHTLFLTKKLPQLIWNAQVINVSIALVFFYLTRVFEVAPKTNLLIYLLVSSPLLYLWRKNAHIFINARARTEAVLVGRSDVVVPLRDEVNNNTRYRLAFTSVIFTDDKKHTDIHKEVLNSIYQDKVKIVVIGMQERHADLVLSNLYNLMFSEIQFIDLSSVYEEVFDRVPLPMVTNSWFLEHVRLSYDHGYNLVKNFIEKLFALGLLIVALPLFPVIALLIRIDSKGKVLYYQKRLGEYNKLITIPKFRTMARCDTGEEALAGENRVTRVGNILRKTRLDELPQLVSVIKGDLALVGPRPEIPELARVYEEKIPYYAMRHLVRPGLSGWAQIYHDEHPHRGTDIENTRDKLSYDLYYLKNRSFVLDLKILLKTLKKIISRSGK